MDNTSYSSVWTLFALSSQYIYRYCTRVPFQSDQTAAWVMIKRFASQTLTFYLESGSPMNRKSVTCKKNRKNEITA